MSTIRAPFPVLQDSASAGAVLTKSLEGDAASGKVGLTAFTYKDSSGNLVLPMLTAAGKVPVDTGGGSGTPVSATTQAAVSGALTETQVIAKTLVATKMYSEIEMEFACGTDSLVRLAQHDNGVETNLGWWVTGPGQFSFKREILNQSFTAGATGTQELRLYATNLYKASDLYGTVAAMQAP